MAEATEEDAQIPTAFPGLRRPRPPLHPAERRTLNMLIDIKDEYAIAVQACGNVSLTIAKNGQSIITVDLDANQTAQLISSLRAAYLELAS